jgi:hypothetical protein
MDGACKAEQVRLLARTAELAAQTRALAPDKRPFSQAEHDALRDQLHRHQQDLADFRCRCLDP